jgi:hypothetical protein
VVSSDILKVSPNPIAIIGNLVSVNNSGLPFFEVFASSFSPMRAFKAYVGLSTGSANFRALGVDASSSLGEH